MNYKVIGPEGPSDGPKAHQSSSQQEIEWRVVPWYSSNIKKTSNKILKKYPSPYEPPFYSIVHFKQLEYQGTTLPTL